MTTFVAILEKEEGTLWSVWFPDLPGCTTAADTAEEAQTRAIEALRLFVEDMLRDGEGVPSPRALDVVMADNDVAAARKGGAIVIAVPLFVNEGTQARVNVSLDTGVLKAIDTEAKRRGMTRSGFLAMAAGDAIQRRA